MKTRKENTETKYYPISHWNNNNDVVKLPFAYSSKKEARETAIRAQEVYQDQTFQNKVIKVNTSNMGKVWKLAGC